MSPPSADSSAFGAETCFLPKLSLLWTHGHKFYCDHWSHWVAGANGANGAITIPLVRAVCARKIMRLVND